METLQDRIPAALQYAANAIVLVNADEETIVTYKDKGDVTKGEYVLMSFTPEQLDILKDKLKIKG